MSQTLQDGRAAPADVLQESERVVTLFRCLLVAVVLTSPLFDGLTPPEGGYLSGLLFATGYCAVSVVWVYRRWQLRFQRHVMLVTDVCLLTLLIHQHGGAHTSLFQLYYVSVIIGAMWFGLAGAVGAASLAIALFVHSVALKIDPDRLYYALQWEVMPQGLLLFLAAILSAYLAEAWHADRRVAADQRRIVEQFRLQIDMARELQSLLVPRQLPTVPGLELAFRARQAQLVVGGDYYDALVLPDGRLGVCCADVSGKGVSGQLRLPLIKYAFRLYARESATPLEMITRLNRLLCDELPDDVFVPLVYAVLDPASGQAELVGKHCPPLHGLAATGEVREVELRGVALGVDADAGYVTTILTLAPDDYLLLYSDGALEARDRHGRELGESGLAALMQRATPESARDLADELYSEIDAYEVGRKQDDLTLLVLHRTGR